MDGRIAAGESINAKGAIRHGTDTGKPAGARSEFGLAHFPVRFMLGPYIFVGEWCGFIPPQPWSNAPHAHSQMEFMFIPEGRGEMEINGARLPLGAGDVAVAMPGEVHRISSERGSPMALCYAGLYVRPASRVRYPTNLPPSPEQGPRMRAFLSGRARVRGESPPGFIGAVFEAIRTQAEAGGDGWVLIMETLARALVMRTARIFVPAVPAPVPWEPPGRWMNHGKTGKKPDPGGVISDLSSLIAMKGGHGFGVRDASHSMGMSSRTLQRLMRGSGYEFRHFKRDILMNVAAFRLITGGRTIRDIALEAGYAKQGKFTEAFRRAFGVTPVGYRCAVTGTRRRKRGKQAPL